MLLREQLRHLFAPLVQELADREEELGALRERHLPPCRERRLSGLHCPVDLLGRCEVDFAGLAPGRGVVDGAAASGFPGDEASADPVADALDARALLDGRGCELGHVATS